MCLIPGRKYTSLFSNFSAKIYSVLLELHYYYFFLCQNNFVTLSVKFASEYDILYTIIILTLDIPCFVGGSNHELQLVHFQEYYYHIEFPRPESKTDLTMFQYI